MKKLLVSAGFVVVACVALAASMLEGVRGEGIAKSAEGRLARVETDIKKATNDGKVRLGGNFVWELRQAGAERPDARIVLRRPANFVLDGNIARFNGPAHATIRRNGRMVTVEGRLNVVVNDRKEGRQGTEKDVIGVEFIGPNADSSHRFEGTIERGDLNVFVRTPQP